MRTSSLIRQVKIVQGFR